MSLIERAREAAKQVIDANRKYALGHPSRRAIYVDAADEAYDIVEAVAPIILEGAASALERIAAIDYSNPGDTPLEFRLRNAVAIATVGLDAYGGQ